MKALSPIALVALTGCPDRTVAALPPVPTGVITKGIPTEADVDLLFVVDNSPSTKDKQDLFATNFPNFVTTIDMLFPNGRPNLHMGVVSTTVGTDSDVDEGSTCPKTAPNDDGLLQANDACGVSGRYIIDEAVPNGPRNVNYSGDLASALGCIAKLGDNGCGFEAPLEAMKRALDGSRTENDGFVRPGAYLAIVFLTDEDDCSVKDPSLFSLQNAGPEDFRCQPLVAYDCDTAISPTTPGTYTGCVPRTGSYLQDTAFYAGFLSTVKDQAHLIVAMIAGDPTSTIMTGSLTIGTHTQTLALLPSCHAMIGSDDAIGRPGIRLADFTNQFGDRGLYDTVCQSDYTGTLGAIGKKIYDAISPCLEGAIDMTDSQPNNPGLQPQCSVSDVVDADTPDAVETLIPTCDMTDPSTPAPGGARPCWWIGQDSAACATETGLELHVERTTQPPSNDTVEVSCVVDDGTS